MPHGAVEPDAKEVETVGSPGDDRGSIGGKSSTKGLPTARDRETGREIAGVGRNEGEACAQEESGGEDHLREA